jgi:hypothetical protein
MHGEATEKGIVHWKVLPWPSTDKTLISPGIGRSGIFSLKTTLHRYLRIHAYV